MLTKEQKRFCEEHKLTEGQFLGKEIIPGNLNLDSLTKIPSGFNPTVGGSLFLYSLKEIPSGFNPTVGGNLDLYSLKEIPSGFNPTVGRDLFLPSLKEIPSGFNPVCFDCYYQGSWGRSHVLPPVVISFPGTRYISCDGIFCEVVRKKGSVFHVKKANSTSIFFLVVVDGKCAHGASLAEARESLKFKISSRDTTRYNSLTVDSKLTYAKMIECYRVITGACEYGVKEFISRKVSKVKKFYQISEILLLTENEFGHSQFKKFFDKN
jgi:hypothetical protein